jgi:SOS response regulatory protein OraA/RecX
LADYPDQTDKILEFLRTRLKTGKDEREVRRATDALLRRGHSYQEIRRAMQQLDFDEDFQEDFYG